MELLEFYMKEVPYPYEQDDISLDELENLLDDRDMKWVYVIGNPSNKLCKIGMTTNLYSRYRSLRSSSGNDLKLLLALQIEPGYDEPIEVIESALHKFYKDKRKIGEWFNLSLRDLIQIRILFWARIVGWDIIDNLKCIDWKTLTVKDTSGEYLC